MLCFLFVSSIFALFVCFAYPVDWTIFVHIHFNGYQPNSGLLTGHKRRALAPCRLLIHPGLRFLTLVWLFLACLFVFLFWCFVFCLYLCFVCFVYSVDWTVNTYIFVYSLPWMDTKHILASQQGSKTGSCTLQIAHPPRFVSLFS